MERRAKALIWDAKTAAVNIMGFTARRTLAEYGADQMLRSAVERQFEIAGEAFARLRRHAPDGAARIPYLAQIIGPRNRLIHGYDAINDAAVWSHLVGMPDDPGDAQAPPTAPPPP